MNPHAGELGIEDFTRRSLDGVEVDGIVDDPNPLACDAELLDEIVGDPDRRGDDRVGEPVAELRHDTERAAMPRMPPLVIGVAQKC